MQALATGRSWIFGEGHNGHEQAAARGGIGGMKFFLGARVEFDGVSIRPDQNGARRIPSLRL